MVSEWGNDQVLFWLKNKNYSDQVLACFRTHNITGITLPMLNPQELKEMGILNMKLRLIIMKHISELLIQKDIQTINANVEHPLISELQSIVISKDLVNSIANSITINTSSNDENRVIMAQFNKIKEDLLPIIKEIKDKKPLPSPIHDSQHNHHHQTQPRLTKSSSSNNMRSRQRQPNMSSTDTLKQLKAKTEDPCYKILQSAMKSHNLNKSDWKKYVLVLCYGGDKERVLQYDEKPVVVFKELHDLGLNPNIMLRQVDTNAINERFDETPGGRL